MQIEKCKMEIAQPDRSRPMRQFGFCGHNGLRESGNVSTIFPVRTAKSSNRSAISSLDRRGAPFWILQSAFFIFHSPCRKASEKSQKAHWNYTDSAERLTYS
jgi:hypothetical protein